jgi:hypothetical protein
VFQIKQHIQLMTPHLVNGTLLTYSQDEFNVPRVQESHHGLSFCPPDNANLIYIGHIAGEGKLKAEHNHRWQQDIPYERRSVAQKLSISRAIPQQTVQISSA